MKLNHVLYAYVLMRRSHKMLICPSVGPAINPETDCPSVHLFEGIIMGSDGRCILMHPS